MEETTLKGVFGAAAEPRNVDIGDRQRAFGEVSELGLIDHFLEFGRRLPVKP